MDIRELIFQALDALNIDQAALAKRLGVGQPTVSRWVSGDTTPDYESCLRLARITGFPPRRVLEVAGRDPLLIPALPDADDTDAARAEVRRRRQAERDQLDQWMSAVGPDYEGFFWDDLKNRADSTVRLIQQIRTAVNPDPGTAINEPSNDRSKRGRRRRDPSDGRLTGTKYAAAGHPAARYRPPLERKAA